MLKKYFLSGALIFFQYLLYSQVVQPDLQDTAKWKTMNRSALMINETPYKGIGFNEVPGNGLMVLKGIDFSNGTIELDIKGSNKMQQSFVGIAFHGQDLNTYDAVYFRPFNFKSEEAIRRSHSVQYISMPTDDWEKLRNEFPGKYENKIEPAPRPDDWFHAKIIVKGKTVSVFVNNAQQPSLEVEKLNPNTKGGIGLWLGNNSGGSFANLKINSSNQ